MACLKKRGKMYYAQYYVGSRQVRKCLQTTSLQVAKEKLRQIETAQLFGSQLPLPTKTPIDKVLAAYAEQVLTVKTFKSEQTDFYYLRETFGPACNNIHISPRQYQNKASQYAQKRTRDYIDIPYFEAVTTTDFSQHIAKLVRRKGLAPKTANRYREILTRLYNWAMSQYGIRMPEGINPAAKVERYKEKAPRIRFLKLEQIDEQLEAMQNHPQLQAMTAVYIFAGLRREEALWLTEDDIDYSAGPNGMIRIRAKAIGGKHWEPKTKVNRMVPISKRLKEYLDRYEVPGSDHGWVFPSPKGAWWDPDNYYREHSKTNKQVEQPWGCL